MDVKINLDTFKDLDKNYKIDTLKFQKMVILYNAIDDGWSIKRHNQSYIFTKKHENKKEILHDSYLSQFLNEKLDLSKIIN